MRTTNAPPNCTIWPPMRIALPNSTGNRITKQGMNVQGKLLNIRRPRTGKLNSL